MHTNIVVLPLIIRNKTVYGKLRLKYIIFILFCIFFSFCSGQSWAQTAKERKEEAALRAEARKRAADSINAVRKYKNSKKYKDSVAKAKKLKLAEMKKARTDSISKAPMTAADSARVLQKVRMDSLRAAQKERAEKTLQNNKYKKSKRYADSVAIAKRTKSDSLKNAMEKRRNETAKARKHIADSMKAVRTHFSDSVKKVRTKFTDSIKLVRKKRMDSLNKVKADKLKMAKAKEKKAEQKKALALEIKTKQKREKFTNMSMLKKKWSPFRRFTQNSFTHYNYYYNANRKMELANANMLRGGFKENYDSLIGLFPYDPNRDSSLLAADMDSIIRKASLGIQIHDPRVKWSNDLYLLMGQAYYYKGSYENAAATFKYVMNSEQDIKAHQPGKSSTYSRKPTSFVQDEKHGFLDFLKHKSVHNDAILWLARTYTQSGYVENGEAVLSLLLSDPKLPEDLKGRIAVERAFAYLKGGNEELASEQLNIVIEDDELPSWLRMRAAYLNGQLLNRANKYKNAVANYERCLDFFPKLEMDFFARKNIAYNTLLAGGDVSTGIQPLKNVLNDGKYTSYYDQIYYVLGMLSAKVNKQNDAIKYLDLSCRTPKATKKQKTLSFIALGDVHYSIGNYTDAKMAYDSAAKYAGNSNKEAVVLAAQKRAQGLSLISGPAGTIKELDSLLKLAALSDKEQESIAKKYRQKLEKARQDSIKNAEATANAPQQEEAPEATGDIAATTNWYFSNPSLMQQGSNEFKRKWGNRGLVDNWRRVSTGGGSTNTEETAEEDASNSKQELAEDGLPSIESLLAVIPKTAKQKADVEKKLQKAYIQLAKAYFNQLDDYKQAGNTLDSLDKKVPNHVQQEETMYLRYKIAMRENNIDKAFAISKQFLSQFPNSPYAMMLRPKNDESKGGNNNGIAVNTYYDETYDLVVKHQYTEALMHVGIAKKSYGDPTFLKRFIVVEAMANAGQGNYDQADTILNKFIAANPNDSLTDWAQQVQAYVKDVRKNGVPTWYKNLPPIDSVKLARKAAEAKKKAEALAKVNAPPPPPKRPADVPLMFTYVPEESHHVILKLRSLDKRTGPLKKQLQTDTLQVLIDMYSTKDVFVMIEGFKSAEAAENYIDSLIGSETLNDYDSTEYETLIVSTKNYKKLFYDKEIDKYLAYYNTYYKKPEETQPK